MTVARHRGVAAALSPAAHALEAALEAVRPPPKLHGLVHGCLVHYVRMILPQVHLRKPCYDFSFL